ncbi:MAG: hypothetical protein HKN67_00020, partial [Saprospiraceae bacterium]|nr:hypothetical protein [Saprospiraceae bacterium]
MLTFYVTASLFGQNQRLADSLEIVYNSGNYEASEKLAILKNIVANKADVAEAISYANILLSEAQALDSVYYIISAYLEIGNAHRLHGDYSKALETFFSAAELAISEENAVDLALTQIAI